MANNIYIGYGLMLQGRIAEAIAVFRKEHDSCKARFNASRTDPLVLKDLLASEGYLLYALGMDFWMKGKKAKAEKSFRDSFDALSRAYDGNKDKAMPFLVEHLLSELRRGNKPPDMDSQLKFINEWEEKHKKKEGEKSSEPVELNEKLLLKIESSIKKLIGPEAIKRVAAREKEEKGEYRVWHKDSESRGERIGSKIKEDKIKNARDYELLILREEAKTHVFIKGTKSRRPPGKLAYRILAYFLKNKGSGGTAWNIAQHVWGSEYFVPFDDVRETIKAIVMQKRIEKARIENSKITIEHISTLVRRRIADLNKLFLKKLNVRLNAQEMEEYEFVPRIPKYCLIEKV